MARIFTWTCGSIHGALFLPPPSTLAEGPPDVVLRDARVIEAYLGRAGRTEGQ